MFQFQPKFIEIFQKSTWKIGGGTTIFATLPARKQRKEKGGVENVKKVKIFLQPGLEDKKKATIFAVLLRKRETIERVAVNLAES